MRKNEKEESDGRKKSVPAGQYYPFRSSLSDSRSILSV